MELGAQKPQRRGRQTWDLTAREKRTWDTKVRGNWMDTGPVKFSSVPLGLE